MTDEMIEFPRASLENEATTTVLPGARIRGLTGRSIGLFGNSIANNLSEFVPLADNVANEANARIINLRRTRAVFMSRGRFDFTLASQFVSLSLVNLGKKEKRISKKVAQNMNCRMRLECFGNSKIYNYIIECFEWHSANEMDLPDLDDLTPDEAAQILAPYFNEDVFYTMWYDMRHAVHLEEIVENRIRPADHPNGTMHVCSQMYMLSEAIFKIMGYHIFIDYASDDYAHIKDELPAIPAAKIYADIERLYDSGICLPHPADLPAPYYGQIPDINIYTLGMDREARK